MTPNDKQPLWCFGSSNVIWWFYSATKPDAIKQSFYWPFPPSLLKNSAPHFQSAIHRTLNDCNLSVHAWAWSAAVAMYTCYPCVSPIPWNLGFPAAPVRLDAVRSPIIVSLAWVDGMLSSDLVPEMKRWSLALFTTAAPHPSLYTSYHTAFERCIKKDSMLHNIMLGLHIRAPNVTVRSVKLVQTAQAIFLSYQLNNNTMAVACFAATTWPLVALRHWRMSDFFPTCSDPRSTNAPWLSLAFEE